MEELSVEEAIGAMISRQSIRYGKSKVTSGGAKSTTDVIERVSLRD
jgi:hypothetical protein